MADISKELDAFRTAVYGSEVRGAMISVAEKTNEVSEATETAEKERASAEKTRNTSEQTRNDAEKKRQSDTASAISRCDTATERANKAAKSAEEVVAGKGFIASTEKGQANGVATLDASGKVPSEQLPDMEVQNIKASEVEEDEDHRFVSDVEKNKWNTDVGDLTPTFSQASSRANLTSKEKLRTSLGKIMKWFADLKTHAFNEPFNDLNGTDPALALAATMGKELDSRISKKADNNHSHDEYCRIMAVSSEAINLQANKTQSITVKYNCPKTPAVVIAQADGGAPFECSVSAWTATQATVGVKATEALSNRRVRLVIFY